MRLAFEEEDNDSDVDGRTTWESFAVFLRLFLAEYIFELSINVTDCNSVGFNGDPFAFRSVALPSFTMDDAASGSAFGVVASDVL